MNDKEMQDRMIASHTISNMIEEAKQILKGAKEIAEEHCIEFYLQDFYEEVTGEYPDWNGSYC